MREKLFTVEKAMASDGSRTVRVVCSSAGIDRMGDIIVQEGIDFSSYRQNPVVLWAHDHRTPIARVSDIGIVSGKLEATVIFPPEGTLARSDEVHALIQAGIVNAVSIGFDPTRYEPIDPKAPWAGYKFLESELLELSFVSVPANKEALIIGRSLYVAAGEARDAPPERLIQTTIEILPDSDLATLAARLDAVVEKAGRVLSAENEGSLRTASDLIAGVLSKVAAAPIVDDPLPEEPEEDSAKAIPAQNSNAARHRALAEALRLRAAC